MAIWKALGFMSGTSMDGVDAAIIETDGMRVISHTRSLFEAYKDDEMKTIRNVLGHWQGALVDEAARAVLAAHNRALSRISPEEYELVGFHGQTIAHDPAHGKTLQIGDPGALQTDAPIVYDFRSQDVAAGGEGAPLIPIYHHALSQDRGLPERVAFLNIGGVANITYVDTSAALENGVIAFDTGTGNAVIDDIMSQHFGLSFDENGAMAARGQVAASIIDEFMTDKYFLKAPPKSLDRNEFHRKLVDMLDGLPVEDQLASAVEASARAIATGLSHLPKTPQVIIVCGGGRKNRYMMERLAQLTNLPLLPMEMLSLNGDMTEAEGFAFLAARRMRGLASSFPLTTGAPAPMLSGRVYWRGNY